jgi:hypothetical protein
MIPTMLSNLSKLYCSRVSQELVDYFKAAVRHKGLRDADAIGSLMIFEQSSHDARQCQS